MSTREAVLDYLAPILTAEGLELIKSVRAAGTINKPTAVLKTDRYEPNPFAPRTKRQGTFILTVVSPLSDLDDAETQLDDILENLLPSLLGAGIAWSSAQQVGWGEAYLGYDITITSILTKE